MAETLTKQQFLDYVDRVEADIQYWKDRSERAGQKRDELREALRKVKLFAETGRQRGMTLEACDDIAAVASAALNKVAE